MRRLFTSACWWALVLGGTPAVAAKVGDYYFGDSYTYTRSENYESILGGQVSLLEPGGYDYFLEYGNPSAVLLEGPISEESAGVLERLLQAHPRVGTIFLDSPGGDLFAGMRIGQLIAAAGLHTVVNQSAQCQSACALAFLAGRQRLLLGKEADFGFHRQYYIVEGKVRYASWGKDVAQIAAYLRAIGSKGLRAEEIVGTTQQLSMSQERLRDRGVTTASSAEYVATVWMTTTQVTAYELFRAGCYTFEMTPACLRLPPLLEEPRHRVHILAKRLKGDFADLDRGRRGFQELNQVLERVSVDALFEYDCRFSQPSFAAAMQEKAFLKSLYLKGEDLARFQTKRAELDQKCRGLRASPVGAAMPAPR